MEQFLGNYVTKPVSRAEGVISSLQVYWSKFNKNSICLIVFDFETCLRNTKNDIQVFFRIAVPIAIRSGYRGKVYVASVIRRKEILFGYLETEVTSTTTSLRNLGNFVLFDKAKHLRILEHSVTQPWEPDTTKVPIH